MVIQGKLEILEEAIDWPLQFGTFICKTVVSWFDYSVISMMEQKEFWKSILLHADSCQLEGAWTVQIGWSWWIIGWMFPLLNHLFIHEIRITLLNHFSKFQAHTYLQWDNSATVTFLWYAFSQNTYLFHRHCGRHSITRNRMSEVTEALGVGKDCPLQKGTIKKMMISNSWRALAP